MQKNTGRDVKITSVKTHGTAYVVSGTVAGEETIARLPRRELDALPTPADQRRKLAELLASRVPEEQHHLTGTVTI